MSRTATRFTLIGRLVHMSSFSRFGKMLGVTLAAATVLSSVDARTGTITDGPAPDLFLLYTGDVIGHIEPCG